MNDHEIDNVGNSMPQEALPSLPVARPSRKKAVGRYLLSLPERSARAAAAIVGGTLYETSNVALPLAVRQSKLYQVTLDRLLRIVIEWVGDVRAVYQDEETSVQELAARKFTGNVLEFASIFAVGWSPLWILAAASDVMGGSKAYLRALVGELQASGQLPAGSNVASYEELLSRLEKSSGVLADTIDIPPMSVHEARASLDALRSQAHDLPSAEDLAEIFRALQGTAKDEGRSLSDVSAAVGLAAAKAGIELGNTHIFDFYRASFRTIQQEGLLRFLRRTASPYLSRAGKHFLPGGTTYTERFLDYLEQRRGQANG
jgi:hypothetical protein